MRSWACKTASGRPLGSHALAAAPADEGVEPQFAPARPGREPIGYAAGIERRLGEHDCRGYLKRQRFVEAQRVFAQPRHPPRRACPAGAPEGRPPERAAGLHGPAPARPRTAAGATARPPANLSQVSRASANRPRNWPSSGPSGWSQRVASGRVAGLPVGIARGPVHPPGSNRRRQRAGRGFRGAVAAGRWPDRRPSCAGGRRPGCRSGGLPLRRARRLRPCCRRAMGTPPKGPVRWQRLRRFDLASHGGHCLRPFGAAACFDEGQQASLVARAQVLEIVLQSCCRLGRQQPRPAQADGRRVGKKSSAGEGSAMPRKAETSRSSGAAAARDPARRDSVHRDSCPVPRGSAGTGRRPLRCRASRRVRARRAGGRVCR